ncbi:glycosyltransferase [Vreelandella sp. H-I2]
MENPAVSVLMPVYNGLPYLTEALDSLLNQTFQDFEIIAVNDGSTDGSAEVLASYASRDERVVIVTNEENIGLPRSLNKGLEKCRAALVARADADDRYRKDRLEKQVAFLDAHPEVGVLSCWVQKIKADGEFFSLVRFPTEDGEIRVRELFVNSFSHPGVMFRRDLVRGVGGYDPEYWTSEDADLWSRIRPLMKSANLAEPLIFYRKHEGSMMRTRGSEGEKLSLSVRQRLLSEYLDRPLSIDEARGAVMTFRASQGVTADDVKVGMDVIKNVHGEIREREEPSTLRYFETEAISSFMRLAKVFKGSAPALSYALVTSAFSMHPRQALAAVASHTAALVNLLGRTRFKRTIRH